jgi:hypothetical protein
MWTSTSAIIFRLNNQFIPSDWLVGYKSFFSKGPVLSFSVMFTQLLIDYRKVNYYENLRKTEKS